MKKKILADNLINDTYYKLIEFKGAGTTYIIQEYTEGLGYNYIVINEDEKNMILLDTINFIAATAYRTDEQLKDGRNTYKRLSKKWNKE